VATSFPRFRLSLSRAEARVAFFLFSLTQLFAWRFSYSFCSRSAF
jgi:hypothetical protein